MEISERIAEIPRGDSRSELVRCALCDKTTREGKPYCTEHLMQHTYARNVSENYTKRGSIQPVHGMWKVVAVYSAKVKVKCLKCGAVELFPPVDLLIDSPQCLCVLADIA